MVEALTSSRVALALPVQAVALLQWRSQWHPAPVGISSSLILLDHLNMILFVTQHEVHLLPNSLI